MRHVIYVPGLGDHKTYGQPFVLLLWRIFGVRAHYLALGWESTEPFDKKLQKLLMQIDRLQEKHGSVSLVGLSAGASAVLNAYVERKDIKNVVCICGKINNPQTIGQPTYDKNPPFKESVYLLQKNLKLLSKTERGRIMSIHPLEDPVVPPKDTLIDGAVEDVIKVEGHFFAIYCSLIFKAPTICRFIKNT